MDLLSLASGYLGLGGVGASNPADLAKDFLANSSSASATSGGGVTTGNFGDINIKGNTVKTDSAADAAKVSANLSTNGQTSTMSATITPDKSTLYTVGGIVLAGLGLLAVFKFRS